MKCVEITETLWFGDEKAAQRHPRIGSFDEVLTLGYRGKDVPRYSTTEDRFVFVDGEHDYSLFEGSVEYTIEHIEKGHSVFVHCASGVSRSSAVVTTAITELENKSLDAAFQLVSDQTDRADPVVPIRESMEQYTGEKLDDFRNDLTGW